MKKVETVINLHTVVVQSTEPVFRKLDDEFVLLSVRTGKYYGLDAVGSRIWELIEKPTSVSTLRDKLCEEYDVETEQCMHEVLEFLGNLVEEGIVELAREDVE